MGIMPVFPGNPRQKWQYAVLVDGLPAAYFQSAQIPACSVEQDTSTRWALFAPRNSRDA